MNDYNKAWVTILFECLHHLGIDDPTVQQGLADFADSDKIKATSEPNPYELFLSNLVRCRKSQGLEQKHLAAVIGVERSAYTRRELGKSEITVRELIAINQILGVEWSILLGAERDQRGDEND